MLFTHYLSVMKHHNLICGQLCLIIVFTTISIAYSIPDSIDKLLQGSTVEFSGTKPSYPSLFLEVEPMTEQNVHDLDIGENEEASLIENGVVKIGAPCAQTN